MTDRLSSFSIDGRSSGFLIARDLGLHVSLLQRFMVQIRGSGPCASASCAATDTFLLATGKLFFAVSC